MNAQQLSLSLSKIAPGNSFTKLKTPEGEAIHTGGLYLSPDNKEVWKPLDVKPFQNADFRCYSQEAEVLEVMKGQPGFPNNWRIETVNGRKFLVRPFCRVVGQTMPYEYIKLETILEIEQWLRNLNSQYWEVNDFLSIAYDRQLEQFFILDLSAAQQMGNPTMTQTAYIADDSSYFYKFAKECGFNSLVRLRQSAKHSTSSIEWINMLLDDKSDLTCEHKHVYASVNRPIDSSWAKIENALYFDADKGKDDVFTWVIVPKQLSEDVLKKYDLTWGYSPIEYQA